MGSQENSRDKSKNFTLVTPYKVIRIGKRCFVTVTGSFCRPRVYRGLGRRFEDLSLPSTPFIRYVRNGRSNLRSLHGPLFLILVVSPTLHVHSFFVFFLMELKKRKEVVEILFTNSY